jgi:hypothetical protein
VCLAEWDLLSEKQNCIGIVYFGFGLEQESTPQKGIRGKSYMVGLEEGGISGLDSNSLDVSKVDLELLSRHFDRRQNTRNR